MRKFSRRATRRILSFTFRMAMSRSVSFMSFLLARDARVEGDLGDQLFNSTEKRLARVLPAAPGTKDYLNSFVGKRLKYPLKCRGCRQTVCRFLRSGSE